MWASWTAGGASSLHEALLLAAATAPALAGAAPFASTSPGGVAASLATVALALAALALLLGFGRLQPPALRAAVFAWSAAAPLALLILRDLGWRGDGWRRVAALTPPWAATSALDGRVEPAWLLAAGALAALVLATRLRGRRGALAASALALALALPAVAAGEPTPPRPTVRRARPLLGPHVRPGEPSPLRLELAAAAPGWVAARSLGWRFTARAAPVVDLVPTALGAGQRLTVEAAADGGGAPAWEACDVSLPEPRPVPTERLLVGALGPGAAELAALAVGERRATVVALDRELLDLLARGGHALDAVVVSPGAAARAAPHLRAWTAAGGVLVCLADVDRLAVTEVAPQPGEPAALVARPLGAGWVLGPSTPLAAEQAAREAATSPLLPSRLERRARRVALAAAMATGPAPGPTPAQVRRAAAAALACGLLFGLLGPLRARARPATLVAGAAAFGLSLAVGVQRLAAPAGCVYGATAEVLELPVGERVARRLTSVRLRGLRPGAAQVTLAGWAPPVPVPDDAGAFADAVVSGAPDRPPSLAGVFGARSERRYLQVDALADRGPLRAEPAPGGALRLINETGLPLRSPLVLRRGGVVALPDLPAGEALLVDLAAPPLPFGRWRWAGETAAERHRRRMVAAALSGRDPGTGWILVADAPARLRLGAGAAGERAAPTLVVVDGARPAP